MSQRAVKDATGISQAQVSKVLAGSKPITITELQRLCAAFGLDPLDVLRRAGA